MPAVRIWPFQPEIAGFVAVALQVLAFVWIPSFAIPLWVLLASLAGLRVPERTTSAA